MRILHITHQYLPDHVGGVEHYARGLALRQRDAGHEVALFCRASGTGQHLDKETMDGFPVYRATKGRLSPSSRFLATLGDRFLADSLTRTIQETDPEVIHLHHLMGLPPGPLARQGHGIPIVATLHDYWWVCANAQLLTDYSHRVCRGPRWWLNCARCGLARGGARRAWPAVPAVAALFAVRSLLLRKARREVALWIAPTEFVRDWHVAHGLPAGRVRVIGHGIEMPPPGLTRQHGRDRSGVSLQLAYIGGLSPQKGVHVLVDAFGTLPESARLTVAGDESAFPGYCADLRRRARHPGIRFAGRLDRSGVWQTLLSSDALAVPSLWYETASLVIQEAFAVGTPVIASDLGALAERVRTEVDGLLVPPGDAEAWSSALRRLIDEPGLLARLQGGIRPPISMAEHAAELESVYGQLVAQAGN